MRGLARDDASIRSLSLTGFEQSDTQCDMLTASSTEIKLTEALSEEKLINILWKFINVDHGSVGSDLKRVTLQHQRECKVDQQNYCILSIMSLASSQQDVELVSRGQYRKAENNRPGLCSGGDVGVFVLLAYLHVNLNMFRKCSDPLAFFHILLRCRLILKLIQLFFPLPSTHNIP